MIEIMNLRNTWPHEDYDFYIDRRSSVGNPYPMRDQGSREEVCLHYETWFRTVIGVDNIQGIKMRSYLQQMLNAYKKYGKLRLFCWCAPKRCHGETIKQWLEENK